MTNEEKLALLLDSIEYIGKGTENSVHIQFKSNVVISSPKSVALIGQDAVILEGGLTLFNCFEKFRKFCSSSLEWSKAINLSTLARFLEHKNVTVEDFSQFKVPDFIEVKNGNGKNSSRKEKRCERAIICEDADNRVNSESNRGHSESSCKCITRDSTSNQ